MCWAPSLAAAGVLPITLGGVGGSIKDAAQHRIAVAAIFSGGSDACLLPHDGDVMATFPAGVYERRRQGGVSSSTSSSGPQQLLSNALCGGAAREHKGARLSRTAVIARIFPHAVLHHRRGCKNCCARSSHVHDKAAMAHGHRARSLNTAEA